MATVTPGALAAPAAQSSHAEGLSIRNVSAWY